jgi:hypothetical protein
VYRYPTVTDAFWKPWEKEIDSFERAQEVIHGVFDGWSSQGRLFAWRGQVDAAWALASSLYRRLAWTLGGPAAPQETQLQAVEKEILKAAHRWGLHTGERGRLSVLSQLAVLQHYGTPTRLIDITFNPLIGLWFAVEQQWDNGQPKNEDRDGRLFAIDVTNRLINEDGARRRWEDELRRPWPRPDEVDAFREWTTHTYSWKPAHLDHRIAAQNGGFLLGGVPTSGTADHPVQWPKGPNPADGRWTIDEVRRAVSVPLRVHKIEPDGGGAPPDNPVYTLRIKRTAKVAIRKHLQDLYGYRHSTIYRDYSGFALYGHPSLKSRP